MTYLAVLLLAAGLQCVPQARSDSVCRPSELFYINDVKDCGSCYSFDLVLRTWTEARSYCRSQGGNLVSIETAEENEFLKRIILNNKEHPLIKEHLKSNTAWFGFWTSGSDEAKEENWIWNAIGSDVTFTDWYPNQPDNKYGKENYLMARAADGRWNDGHKSWRLFSICERARVC